MRVDKEQFVKGARAAFEAAHETDNDISGFVIGMLAQLAYAQTKHKGWPSADAVHASAILNEEAGKLTEACIDHHYGHRAHHITRARIEETTFRVAAMAYRLYMDIEQYPHPNPEKETPGANIPTLEEFLRQQFGRSMSDEKQ